MRQKSWKSTFITIWSGQAVSLLTSSIIQFAIIWDLTARTNSAAVLSIASLVGFLPMALFSPFIGALVDRWNRKTIMIAADAGIALTTLVLSLLAFSGPLPIGAVMVILFLRAVGSAFHQPCLQAVTPQIVPEAELTRYNGYTTTFQSISFIASPALASVLYAALPLGPLLLLDVLGAAVGVSTIAISTIPRLAEQPKTRVRVVHEALDALKLLRKHRGLFWLVIIGSVFSLVYVPVASLYPLLTMGYFGGTTTEAGLVEMAFAVGMFVGGLLLGLWGGTKNRMVMMVSAIVLLSIGICVSGLLPPSALVVFIIATFFTGFSGPFFNSPFMAIIQTKIPPEYLGRILGVTSSMMALATPLGLAISGLFADGLGIQNWFALSGVLTLLCAVPCLAIRSVRTIDTADPSA